jgi:hypothetical protein
MEGAPIGFLPPFHRIDRQTADRIPGRPKKKPPPACPDGGLPKEEDCDPSTFYAHIIKGIPASAIDECHITRRKMAYNFRRGIFFMCALRVRSDSRPILFTDSL